MSQMRCQNCDWAGPEEDAVPARDIIARHEIGDVFSDLECPECGALVRPAKAAKAETAGLVIEYHYLNGEVGAYLLGSEYDTGADLKADTETWFHDNPGTASRIVIRRATEEGGR